MYARLESLQDRAKLKQLESTEVREANTISFRLATLSMNPLDKSRGFRCATWHSAETARSAIAIERFRRGKNILPASLNQLVPQYLESVPIDHFSGLPLQFAFNAEGYSLFSSAEHEVGKNASWQYFPPVRLRTSFRVSSPFSSSQANNGSNQPFQPFPPIPNGIPNPTDLDAVDKIIRDTLENAGVARRMHRNTMHKPNQKRIRSVQSALRIGVSARF